MPDLPALAAIIALTFAAASTGAIFKPGAWYAGLRKPGWTPPNWAFPLVWTVLYALMAAAAWRVWRAGGAEALPALGVYGAHLVVNAAWSWLFFGLRRLDYALYEVALLWLSIAATMLAFAGWSAGAAWMLAPYLAWVTLAAFLNLRLLQMNGARG